MNVVVVAPVNCHCCCSRYYNYNDATLLLLLLLLFFRSTTNKDPSTFFRCHFVVCMSNSYIAIEDADPRIVWIEGSSLRKTFKFIESVCVWSTFGWFFPPPVIVLLPCFNDACMRSVSSLQWGKVRENSSERCG